MIFSKGTRGFDVTVPKNYRKSLLKLSFFCFGKIMSDFFEIQGNINIISLILMFSVYLLYSVCVFLYLLLHALF